MNQWSLNRLKNTDYFMSTVITLSILMLVACTPVHEDPMKLATNDWPGYRPLYLAQNLGYLKQKDVHLVELTSASEVLRNFRNSMIDAAALTLDEALLLKQAGFDIQIILVMDISHGGDAIIARKDISNIQALRGGRVGVEKTALGAFMLSRALEVSGLSVSEFETTALEYSEHENAFLQGKVDAVVTFDPVRSHLLKADGNIIFDSSQIPGEIVDVLVVRKQYLRQYPDKVKRTLSGWFRALEAMRTKRDESLSILASMSNLSGKEYRKVLEGLRFPDFTENLKLLNQSEPILCKRITRLKNMMLDKYLLNNDIDISNLCNHQLLLKAGL